MLNMTAVTKRYNDMMNSLALEYLTIGTSFSEDTDGWNLRDMVAEADYQLGTYYESGHANADMRDGEEDERKIWRSDVGKLTRFIKAYEPYVVDMKCTAGHCSRFDK